MTLAPLFATQALLLLSMAKPPGLSRPPPLSGELPRGEPRTLYTLRLPLPPVLLTHISPLSSIATAPGLLSPPAVMPVEETADPLVTLNSLSTPVLGLAIHKWLWASTARPSGAVRPPPLNGELALATPAGPNSLMVLAPWLETHRLPDPSMAIPQG